MLIKRVASLEDSSEPVAPPTLAKWQETARIFKKIDEDPVEAKILLDVQRKGMNVAGLAIKQRLNLIIHIFILLIASVR